VNEVRWVNKVDRVNGIVATDALQR